MARNRTTEWANQPTPETERQSRRVFKLGWQSCILGFRPGSSSPSSTQPACGRIEAMVAAKILSKDRGREREAGSDSGSDEEGSLKRVCLA